MLKEKRGIMTKHIKNIVGMFHKVDMFLKYWYTCLSPSSTQLLFH